HDHTTSRSELDEQLRRLRPSRGSRNAIKVFGFLDGRSDSPGESRSRVAFHGAGLPAPQLQAEIRDESGNFVARTDFLFETLGVVGEFDGASKYRTELRGRRTVEQVVMAEKHREDRIRALGWVVVRWIWADLTEPTDLVERIR